MASGTYTLVLHLTGDATVEVGALGDVEFAAGWYAYTGTAFGPGGFSRIDRHRDVAAGENDTRHWHVDYLLGHPAVEFEGAYRTPSLDAECEVTARLDGDPVPGFGASDCACDSHLVYAATEETLCSSVAAIHEDGPVRGSQSLNSE